ncbi:Hypothetical protein, putative [Bodo saltans]|uniref:Uncharacterized protein n=1 Tax=Bodo saltans TaxID=75058 RepID=A0A0S4IN13_BODSA|nr:Hypothetical protein, putative [Bodo saltans]|eukprot:CUE77651.1 Hypothetical protein, putative [Bodo saltans]
MLVHLVSFHSKRKTSVQHTMLAHPEVTAPAEQVAATLVSPPKSSASKRSREGEPLRKVLVPEAEFSSRDHDRGTDDEPEGNDSFAEDCSTIVHQTLAPTRPLPHDRSTWPVEFGEAQVIALLSGNLKPGATPDYGGLAVLHQLQRNGMLQDVGQVC